MSQFLEILNTPIHLMSYLSKIVTNIYLKMKLKRLSMIFMKVSERLLFFNILKHNIYEKIFKNFIKIY